MTTGKTIALTSKNHFLIPLFVKPSYKRLCAAPASKSDSFHTSLLIFTISLVWLLFGSTLDWWPGWGSEKLIHLEVTQQSTAALMFEAVMCFSGAWTPHLMHPHSWAAGSPSYRLTTPSCLPSSPSLAPGGNTWIYFRAHKTMTNIQQDFIKDLWVQLNLPGIFF